MLEKYQPDYKKCEDTYQRIIDSLHKKGYLFTK